MNLKVLSLITLVFISCFSTTAAAVSGGTNYYVDTNGLGGAPSDSNNCTSITTPCRTIQGAFNKNPNIGDTIHIRAGTYKESAKMTTPPGAGTGWLTIRPYQNETVVISGESPGPHSWTQYSGSIYYTTGINWEPKLLVTNCGASGEIRLEDKGNAGIAGIAAKEWWYDSTNQRIYAWIEGGGDPDNCASVKISRYPNFDDPTKHSRLGLFMFYSGTQKFDRIKIENLQFKYSNAKGILINYGGDYVQILNNSFNFIFSTGIRIVRSRYAYINNNTVENSGFDNWLGETKGGEGIMTSCWGSAAFPCEYGVITNNTVINNYNGITMDVGINMTENLVKGNISDQTGIPVNYILNGSGIYTNGSFRMRIQDNISFGNVNTGGYSLNAEEANAIAKENVFVGNISYNNSRNFGMNLNNSSVNNNQLKDNFFVHNTAYNSLAQEFNGSIDAGVPNAWPNTFKNNIFAANQANPAYIVRHSPGANNNWDYNLEYDIGNTPSWRAENGSTYSTFSSYQAAMAPKEANSIYADPLFVNASQANFNLQSTSPAIDKGTPLTTIISNAGTCTAGSSNKIKVAESRYFHGPWGDDGTGTPIVGGDSIRIKGASTDVIRTVSSVDWANHEITVTSSLTCAAGDGMGYSQHWKGSQPDMGAKEYETADTTLSGDLNSDLKVDIKDIQLCVRVILGIETDLKIIQRAKEVALPLDKVDIKDIQGIVKIILGG